MKNNEILGACPSNGLCRGGWPSASLRHPRRCAQHRRRRRALHPAARRSKRVEIHYSDRPLDAIWEGLDGDIVLEDLSIFMNWIITKSRRYALANYFMGMPGLDLDPNGDTYLKNLLGRPVKQVIRELFDTRETLRVSTGMSCLNSALAVPGDVFDGNAIDPFLESAKTLRTCFIGHFPAADQWRAQGYPVDVIELFPQPGDIHWDHSHEALAEADIVFITGLTLVNGTFPEVVRRTPNARYRVLLGPTVPLSPVLFDYGVHLIGSTLILDVDRAIDCCRWGAGSEIFKPEGVMRRVNLTCVPELRQRAAETRPPHTGCARED